jgi:glucosamine kinase
MLLVCDSGSTKADWLLAEGNKVSGPFNTIGFNPFFHSSDFVYETLLNSTSLAPFASKVTELYFFGAGCSSKDRKEIIAIGLRAFFPNAKVIVDHDLLACAYATCGDEPGISCIVGTGSNSCYFDGKEVHEKNYGLGFILGDEGSGSYYGKKLLTQFLYGLMPDDIAMDFNSKYHLDRNAIIDHVYKQPDPNVWLASFARFLTEKREHPYIKSLVHNGMREFLELYVCHFENYNNEKVHFVGSVAFVFQEELKQEASKLNIQIGKVIKQPVDELMNYFLLKKN